MGSGELEGGNCAARTPLPGNGQVTEGGFERPTIHWRRGQRPRSWRPRRKRFSGGSDWAEGLRIDDEQHFIVKCARQGRGLSWVHFSPRTLHSPREVHCNSDFGCDARGHGTHRGGGVLQDDLAELMRETEPQAQARGGSHRQPDPEKPAPILVESSPSSEVLPF